MMQFNLSIFKTQAYLNVNKW